MFGSQATNTAGVAAAGGEGAGATLAILLRAVACFLRCRVRRGVGVLVAVALIAPRAADSEAGRADLSSRCSPTPQSTAGPAGPSQQASASRSFDPPWSEADLSGDRLAMQEFVPPADRPKAARPTRIAAVVPLNRPAEDLDTDSSKSSRPSSSPSASACCVGSVARSRCYSIAGPHHETCDGSRLHDCKAGHALASRCCIQRRYS